MKDREGQGQSHTVGHELGGLQARKEIHRGLITVGATKDEVAWVSMQPTRSRGWKGNHPEGPDLGYTTIANS